jgi:hypothetical protein
MSTTSLLINLSSLKSDNRLVYMISAPRSRSVLHISYVFPTTRKDKARRQQQCQILYSYGPGVRGLRIISLLEYLFSPTYEDTFLVSIPNVRPDLAKEPDNPSVRI